MEFLVDTLWTEGGDLLHVRSRGVRHGPADVLARLGRGEDVDAREHSCRTLDTDRDRGPPSRLAQPRRLHAVAARAGAGVIYDTYPVE
jgi:hypothetical protein